MFEHAPAREHERPAVASPAATPAASPVAPRRAASRDVAAPPDALGASLARAVAQRAATRYPDRPVLARGKQLRTGAAKAPRVRPPHDVDTEPFAADGLAGIRTKKVTAILAPTTVPERGKTPSALAYAGGASPLGFDGGHVIGLHLGGANESANVVPMYPRFNRGVWKALEDHPSRAPPPHGSRWP